MKVDKEWSTTISELVRVIPKQCFRNAFLGAWHADGAGLENPVYVEGWLRFHLSTITVAIEHGWIEAGPENDRMIIDPTLADDPLLEVHEYFASAKYSLQELTLVGGIVLPFVNYGDENHRNAYIQANARSNDT